MLSWPMWLTARASLKNRSTIPGSVAYCGWRNLMATREPMTGCSARYTDPMPPRPRSDTSRYEPTTRPTSGSPGLVRSTSQVESSAALPVKAARAAALAVGYATVLMRFAKLHGLGNDFVLLDLRGLSDARPPSPERAFSLCDRHRGIGADGVLTLLDGDRLLIHNADGSVPEMCGNGARCAALWIATDRCTRPAPLSDVILMTDAGPRPCSVRAEAPGTGLVEVEMGVAEVSGSRALPGGFTAIPVSTGNPHRVIFTDGPRERLTGLARTAGPGLCRAEDANIEVVARAGEARYLVSVWE